MSARTKRADMPLHVSHQNAKDGVALDPHNCTFGQCELSKQHGMDFFVSVDPENPRIWAEWVEREDGVLIHHMADVVRRHRNGKETIHEAITVIAATDVAKRKMLKKFPKQGMDFILTNHTVRRKQSIGGANLRPGETREGHQARLAAKRARDKELAEQRSAGLVPPPRKRSRRVRARFG